MICMLYLVSFGQNLKIYKKNSPRYFLFCHILFIILEVIFFCLIICHGKETAIIRWHLAIINLTSISISVWGIKQKILMEEMGISRNNLENAGDMEDLEWTEILFGVIVYVKAIINGLYMVLSLVFRICPQYFVKILKIDLTEEEVQDSV